MRREILITSALPILLVWERKFELLRSSPLSLWERARVREIERTILTMSKNHERNR
jgi:hypothetical protein